MPGGGERSDCGPLERANRLRLERCLQRNKEPQVRCRSRVRMPDAAFLHPRRAALLRLQSGGRIDLLLSRCDHRCEQFNGRTVRRLEYVEAWNQCVEHGLVAELALAAFGDPPSDRAPDVDRLRL